MMYMVACNARERDGPDCMGAVGEQTLINGRGRTTPD